MARACRVVSPRVRSSLAFAHVKPAEQQASCYIDCQCELRDAPLTADRGEGRGVGVGACRTVAKMVAYESRLSVSSVSRWQIAPTRSSAQPSPHGRGDSLSRVSARAFSSVSLVASRAKSRCTLPWPALACPGLLTSKDSRKTRANHDRATIYRIKRDDVRPTRPASCDPRPATRDPRRRDASPCPCLPQGSTVIAFAHKTQ